MSKAEEKSLKAYPQKIEWVGNQWNGAPFDVNGESRVAYKQGYQQAEKDLELSWEDIEKITDIWDDLHEDEAVYCKTGCDTPEFYQEVLKRFKAQKGE